MAQNKSQRKSSKKTNSGRTFSKKKRNETVNRREEKEAKEVFLIVCEGEKTEPNYFKHFPLPQRQIDVKGFGENPIGKKGNRN